MLLFVCKNRVAFKKFQTSRIPSIGLDLLIFVKIFEISQVNQNFYVLNSSCSVLIWRLLWKELNYDWVWRGSDCSTSGCCKAAPSSVLVSASQWSKKVKKTKRLWHIQSICTFQDPIPHISLWIQPLESPRHYELKTQEYIEVCDKNLK
jgi:hypothetical protein